MDNYIEIDGGVLLVDDFKKWISVFYASDRNVRKTELSGVSISTVFLGMDHQFGEGLPILYETMVFGGQHDEHQERYHTREDAISGHNRILAMVRRAEDE